MEMPVLPSGYDLFNNYIDFVFRVAIALLTEMGPASRKL